jgi:hypothetical protein
LTAPDGVASLADEQLTGPPEAAALSRRGLAASRMRAVTDEQIQPPSEHDEPIDGEELTEEERQVLANVARILRRIKFGTVVLVVQDGKVVQIEMAEKFRMR